MVNFIYSRAVQTHMAGKHHNGVNQPPSRGVPSKESLWLDDLRKRRDSWKYNQNVRLELDQILQLIFPEKYQKKYYTMAIEFMKNLLEKQELRGDDIGAFLREKGYSKATFYNVILPRLRRVGMLSLEREEFHHKKAKQKYYKKIVRPSTQFSVFWKHIADEYESIVQTAKAKLSMVTQSQTEGLRLTEKAKSSREQNEAASITKNQ